LCLGSVDNFDQGLAISPPTEITVTTNPESALHLFATFLQKSPESIPVKPGPFGLTLFGFKGLLL
jgi:hypothetical protein